MNKILAISLSILTLMGSLSFSLQKMECLNSGKTWYSVTSFDCCNSDQNGEAISSKCCNLESFNLESGNFISSKVNSEKDQTNTLAPVVNLNALGNLQFQSRIIKSNFNIPPPFLEMDFQVLFQSFLC